MTNTSLSISSKWQNEISDGSVWNNEKTWVRGPPETKTLAEDDLSTCFIYKRQHVCLNNRRQRYLHNKSQISVLFKSYFTAVHTSSVYEFRHFIADFHNCHTEFVIGAWLYCKADEISIFLHLNARTGDSDLTITCSGMQSQYFRNKLTITVTSFRVGKSSVLRTKIMCQ